MGWNTICSKLTKVLITLKKPTFFVKQVEDFFPTFISKSRIPKNSWLHVTIKKRSKKLLLKLYKAILPCVTARALLAVNKNKTTKAGKVFNRKLVEVGALMCPFSSSIYSLCFTPVHKGFKYLWKNTFLKFYSALVIYSICHNRMLITILMPKKTTL